MHFTGPKCLHMVLQYLNIGLLGLYNVHGPEIPENIPIMPIAGLKCLNNGLVWPAIPGHKPCMHT
jgi:hypothetical protein